MKSADIVLQEGCVKSADIVLQEGCVKSADIVLQEGCVRCADVSWGPTASHTRRTVRAQSMKGPARLGLPE